MAHTDAMTGSSNDVTYCYFDRLGEDFAVGAPPGDRHLLRTNATVMVRVRLLRSICWESGFCFLKTGTSQEPSIGFTVSGGYRGAGREGRHPINPRGPSPWAYPPVTAACLSDDFSRANHLEPPKTTRLAFLPFPRTTLIAPVLSGIGSLSATAAPSQTRRE